MGTGSRVKQHVIVVKCQVAIDRNVGNRKRPVVWQQFKYRGDHSARLTASLVFSVVII